MAYRNLVDALGRLRGAPYACAVSMASRLLGRGISLDYEEQSGLYRVTDRFGTHRFCYPARLWAVWNGLAFRGKYIGEQYLIDQVPLKDDDIIVDVGANIGDLALHLQSRNVRARVIAFEPAPREFATLQANLAASPGVASHEAHQVALWHSSEKSLTFYLSGNEADNSLLPIEKYTDAIEVPTRRLDDMLPDQRYKLLKLEAEGAEPEILAGAEGVLTKFEYVAADVGFERGMRAESTLPEVTNILTAAGFRLIGYDGRRHSLLFHRPPGDNS